MHLYTIKFVYIAVVGVAVAEDCISTRCREVHHRNTSAEVPICQHNTEEQTEKRLQHNNFTIRRNTSLEPRPGTRSHHTHAYRRSGDETYTTDSNACVTPTKAPSWCAGIIINAMMTLQRLLLSMISLHSICCFCMRRMSSDPMPWCNSRHVEAWCSHVLA